MGKTADLIEFTTEQDQYYDFCLWDYEPVTPTANKFRCATLLFHSLDVINADERTFDLVQAIREGIGTSHTVWGLKKRGDEITCEFYFYDYRRTKRERSITKFIDILKPFAQCGIALNENLHYFMFSVDINDELLLGSHDLDEIHMYIGNPGSTVSSGICYSLTGRGRRLENFYFFFDAKKQWQEIIGKASCSAHLDLSQIDIDQVLWPELKECNVIVVANKQNNDGIYFSRIDIDQLIFFLRRMDYPENIVSFVEENRSRLDHLLFDVGFDYRMEGSDLVILKSAYYGIF